MADPTSELRTGENEFLANLGILMESAMPLLQLAQTLLHHPSYAHIHTKTTLVFLYALLSKSTLIPTI